MPSSMDQDRRAAARRSAPRRRCGRSPLAPLSGERRRCPIRSRSCLADPPARTIVRRMEVIPVIDLRGGVVVRARMGQRDHYRPIETPLSATSDAVDVTRGLLSLFPFRTLYVADLDAIERTGNNDAA